MSSCGRGRSHKKQDCKGHSVSSCGRGHTGNKIVEVILCQAVVEVTQETRLYMSFCVKVYQGLQKEYKKSALKIYIIIPCHSKKGKPASRHNIMVINFREE